MSQLVPLVQLGFLGFAVAVMLFSYTLLAKLAKFAVEDVAIIREKAKEIRIFMGFSMGIVLIGLFYTLWTPMVTVHLDVDPNDLDGYLVKHHGERIDITGELPILLNVRNEALLHIGMHEIKSKIGNLESEIESLKSQVGVAIQRETHGSLGSELGKSEAGI